MKKWEVYLIADSPSYQIVSREFRSLRSAKRYMKKNLGGEAAFYCAVISTEDEKEFKTFYWNGCRIVPWDKPSVLSSRQALNIE